MSILLADVVSVGSRVVRYHDGLLIVGVLMYFVVCGKADMLVLVVDRRGTFKLCLVTLTGLVP